MTEPPSLMRRDRSDLIDDLFNDALDVPPAQREAFVRRSCGDDVALRRELESLLAAHHAAGEFLAGPAAELELVDVPSADLPLPVGASVGAYRLVRVLATGGMGTVYEAARSDEAFRQRVAIKVLRFGIVTPAMRRRFHVERQTLAHLEHPYITRLIDGGTTEERIPYLVMEYVDGQPIDQYCDERRLGVRERLELFRKVCVAVQVAHQNLIVHRDLKPSNILVTPEGDPKLVDFGIAKLLDASGHSSDATLTALRALTPRYASPEQVRGEATTTLSDVYSLGVILYELLTGHRPYALDARSDSQQERIVCEQDPTAPSVVVQRPTDIVTLGRAGDGTTPDKVGQLRGEEPAQLRRRLQGDLDNIILKALRRDPGRRYSSVEQFADDVGRYLRGWPVRARKDTLAYRTAKLVKRNKPVVAAVACLILALILGVIGTGSGWLRARRAERLALTERNAAVAARADAQAVTAYLQRMFTAANPYRRARPATVLELLADAEARIERDLAGKPAIEAGVRYAIGHTYAGMWMWRDAARHLRVALRRYREAGLERTEEVAKCLTLLGRAQTFAKAPVSVDVQREAVAIRRELYGEDDARTAECKGNLAYALWHGVARADYELAERLYRESIAVIDRGGSKFRPDLARFTFSLGQMLHVLRRFDDAKPLFERSLAVYRALPVQEDRYMVECMKKYAGMLVTVGELDRAEELLFEVLRATPVGKDGSKTERVLWRLGRARLDRKDAGGAERAFLACMSRACTDAAATHPELEPVLSEYAQALDPNRPADKRNRPVVPAVAKLREVHWRDPALLDDRLGDLAICLTRSGDGKAAATMLRRHLDAIAGEEVRSAVASIDLAVVLAECGKTDEALAILRRALAVMESSKLVSAAQVRRARETFSEVRSLATGHDDTGSDIRQDRSQGRDARGKR